MPVRVPDFASVVRAQPQARNMPLGAIVGIQLGDALAGISQSITDNRQTKESLLSFADIMAEDDPKAANVYRAMAENIPLFTPTQGGPSIRGGGKTGGVSFAGMQGAVMEDMMHYLRESRDRETFAQNQAVGAKFESMLIGLRHKAELEEIGAREQSQKSVIGEEYGLRARLEQLQHLWDQGNRSEDLRVEMIKIQQKAEELAQRGREHSEKMATKQDELRLRATEDITKAASALARAAGGGSTTSRKPTERDIAAFTLSQQDLRSRLEQVAKKRRGRQGQESIVGGVPKSVWMYPDSDERAALEAEEKAIYDEAYRRMQVGSDSTTSFIQGAKGASATPSVTSPSAADILGRTGKTLQGF